MWYERARPTSERQESCATEEYGKIPHDSSTLSIEQLSCAHIESELMLCKLCTHHTYVMRSTWLRPHPPESETDGTRQKIEVLYKWLFSGVMTMMIMTFELTSFFLYIIIRLMGCCRCCRRDEIIRNLRTGS